MKTFLMCGALLALSPLAHSQWTNPELQGRGMPESQIRAIFEGDAAACRREAQSDSAAAQPQRCSEFLAPFEFQQCQAANTRSRSDSEVIVLGCMARRGWSR